jgi:hypothetical protein
VFTCFVSIEQESVTAARLTSKKQETKEWFKELLVLDKQED